MVLLVALGRVGLPQILRHGDFASVIATTDAELALATLPGGRPLYFASTTALAQELTQNPRFRNRQDAAHSRSGLVGNVDERWAASRAAAAAVLQSGRVLRTQITPRSVDAARSLPPYATLLPPADVLAAATAVVERVSFELIFSAAPPEAPLTTRRRPPSALVRRASLALARAILLARQLAALLAERGRRRGFFELAEDFTNKNRKVERGAARLRAGLRPPPPSPLLTAAEHHLATRLAEARGGGDAAAAASDDLLGALLGDAALDDDEVRAVVRDLLTAGVETTAAALATTVLLLNAHPEVRDACVAEAAAAAADGSSANGAGDLGALPLCEASVKEAMRLQPPAALLLRVAGEDASLGGIPIPAGAAVVSSTAALGREAARWERPDAFDPHRFLAPSSRREARASFLAFGGGPRACVGRQMATTICVAALAEMLRAAAAAEAEGEV